MARKILFVSLGCDKNLVDSERMLGTLADQDYTVTDDEYEADVIVVNTCAFIDQAKEESIQSILEMGQHKEDGRCRALIVTGCMAERYRQEILDEMPEVDAVLGNASEAKIGEAIEEALQGHRNVIVDPLDDQSREKNARPLAKRMISTGGHYEYLKIAEGCDKHCTYCIIPRLRGRYQSRPIEELTAEAEELVRQGVRELILIAEETTIYGRDLYGEKSLHVLLKKLCEIPDLHWIRILYCYPEEIYPELIRTIREEPKICHYLDMPIQHINDDILRRMGRFATKEGLIGTIRTLRREIPDIALRTTLITGFPGETEEQHEELLDFVREMKFDRLGVFTYSREDGTPAALLGDQIPEDVKERRRDELLSAQQQISLQNGREKIGRTLEVQIEGYMPEDDVYVGRTCADTPGVDGYFFVSTDQTLHSGDFVKAVVTGATEYDLTGERKEV